MNIYHKTKICFTLGIMALVFIVMVPISFATTIDEQKVFNVQAFLKKETTTQWIVGITWNVEPFGSIQYSELHSSYKIYDRNGTLIETQSGGGGFSPAIWDSTGYAKSDWSGIQFTGSRTFTKNANYYYVEIYIWAYWYNGITQLDWSGDTAVFYFPRTDNSCPVQTGDPVNLSNGNQSERQTDLSLDTPSGKLTFERTYNAALGNTSDDYNVGPLGRGWTFNYNYSLSVSGSAPNREAYFQKEDGKIIRFQETSGVFSQTTPGERFTLTDNGSGAFTVLKDDGTKIHFVNTIDDNTSYLRTDWIEDAKGRQLTFTYASHRYAYNVWTELPTEIHDQWGNGFGFTHEYDPNAYCDHYTGRIESVYNLKTPTEKVTFAYTQPTTETYTGMHNLATATYPDTSVIHYYYDDADNPNSLTRAVDEKGDTRYYTYDQYNRANGQHKEGNVNQLTMNYDWRQQGDGTWTVTAIDSLSRNRVYTLSDSGNNRTITVAGPTCGGGCGSNKTYIYDKTNGNLLQTEDGNNVITQYTNYDAWGNAATVTEAVGTSEQRVTTSSYNANLNLLLTRTVPSVLGAGNKQTIYDYDNDGNSTPNENPTPFLHRLIEKGYTRDLSGAIVLKEYITTYAYNGNGQITSINGPRTDVTDVTTYSYYPDDPGQGNNRARLYQVTTPESQTTTYGNYDAYGRVGSITDPNGLITQYTYDFKGRVSTITLVAAGPTGEDLITSNFYEANGNLDYVQLPGGGVIDYGYDAAGRLTSITRRIGPNASSAAIDSINYTYDTEGNKTAETLQEGEVTGPTKKSATFAYDDYNRLWKLIHADSTYQEYGYDAAGNRTSAINEKAKETTSLFDALNRLKTLTQPGSIVTGYNYDPQDNPTQVTDANNKITTYEYDDFGRMLKVNSPDAGITEYRYDEAGNLIKKIDALGIITNFTYDALNRMLTLDLPGTSQDITYTYDSGTNGIDHLTNIADPSGTIAFQYDKRGNITQEQKTMEGHVFTTQYQYDQNGNLNKITYPNGREVTYTLNQANQITQVDGTINSTNTTYAQSATYAPFGPLKTYIAGNSLPIINQYDADYQLTTLKAGAVINRNYQYDETGNITQISNRGALPAATAEALTYSYQNNNNQLTQAINGTNTTFAYNSAGNLITEQKNTVTRTYTYNDHQRLASVTENSITLGQYTYDALGKRTKKVAGGTTTLYIYDRNGLLIAEYDGSGTWQKDYVYLNGQPLTMIVANTPENVYYYHNDHLGTPQMMTDSTGTIVWAATYEPFGEATIAPTSTVTNNLRFPGQYFDAETGLCYNWNRDYNQQLGRYIESDPIGLDGGINLYTYVANQPTVYIDPTGLWVDWIHLDMTRTAAREAGCSKAAEALAIATAKVDYLPDSNEPEHGFWHAMVNGYRDAAGRAEDIQNYYDRVNRYTKSCKPEELGLALHAVQDSYAPAHRGFQPWYNRRRDYLPHLSDMGTGGSGRMNATYRTRQIIETAKENCPCLCK